MKKIEKDTGKRKKVVKITPKQNKKIHLFYDNADLLQIFNISPSTLRRYRINGYFKYLKIGGKYFYPINDIKRLAETGIPHNKTKLF